MKRKLAKWFSKWIYLEKNIFKRTTDNYIESLAHFLQKITEVAQEPDTVKKDNLWIVEKHSCKSKKAPKNVDTSGPGK